MNITVLGSGAWGTALAISLAQQHSVTLWARNVQQVSDMRISRKNQRYLPDVSLSQSIKLEHDFNLALHDAQMIVLAVPISAARNAG
jgi:glycerol-3-phosphate dehydrogenase (NAD(P)+)